MTAEALVSPDLLRWARERAAMPLDALAEKLKIETATLSAWEAGSARPTFRQAEKIAAAAHVPFGFLFLPEPPEEAPPIPDLRTQAGTSRAPFSADFLDLLRDVMFKLDWFREYLLDHGAERREFVGRFTTAARPEIVAQDIRAVLGSDPDVGAAGSWDQHLTRLFDRCEAAGIWVMRTGTVGNNTHRVLSVVEFRGFAIADDICPLIVINGRDARAAQAFTLVHELAHIWLGQSGISNPFLGRRGDNEPAIERTCNAIAAEVLVPCAAFLAWWDENRDLAENADALSRHFKVSRAVIARRALDTGKITRDRHHEFFEQESSTWSERAESGGGDFYATAQVRNRKRFTRAVLGSAMSGTLLLRDAGRLLGMKPAKVRTIHERLVPDP